MQKKRTFLPKGKKVHTVLNNIDLCRTTTIAQILKFVNEINR